MSKPKMSKNLDACVEMEGADEWNSDADRVIEVSEEDEIISLEERLKENPRKLSQTAGNTSCSIFRVPQSLVEINEKAYQPQIVSVGPYHHGKQHLNMIEEHKVVYLRSFLARLHENVDLNMLLKKIELMEDRVRLCYSEVIDLGTRELVNMMVLDGCFIIELFCRVTRLVPRDPNDPIINMAWILPFLMRDLLQMENQLPFFVLQTLYDASFPRVEVTNETNMPLLAKLALDFFNFIIQRPDSVVNSFQGLNPNHLLGLLHKSFEPSYRREQQPRKTSHRKLNSSLQLIQSAEKLDLAGIEFRRVIEEEISYLGVKFRKGVLQMPLIRMDDFTTSLILNSIAYEQCYCHCSNHNTSYAVFMGCLINTPSDVGLLSKNKIIENYLGTDEEVVRFFDNIRKDVVLDIQKCYLRDVFEDVNYHYGNNWQVQIASFKNTYFNSPWSFISALAAVVLLGLTTTQTFLSVHRYISPPK